MQPARDLIVVDALPSGTLDPSVDRSLPLDRQTGEGMGIDATFPFGARSGPREPGPSAATSAARRWPRRGTSTSRSRMCRGGRSMSFRNWNAKGVSCGLGN
jgi:hypothetical protein